MHYWGRDILDNDAATDAKLPFKTTSHTPHYIIFEQPASHWISKNPYSIVAGMILLPIYFHCSSHLNKLFRPPRG